MPFLKASQEQFSSSPSISTPRDRRELESQLLLDSESLLYAMLCGIVCALVSRWADAATNLNHIAAGFDQETAAVVMSRMAVARSENDDGPDVLRWLDRMLIRLVSPNACVCVFVFIYSSLLYLHSVRSLGTIIKMIQTHFALLTTFPSTLRLEAPPCVYAIA